MPIETRTLLFDRNELKAAVHAYALNREIAADTDRLVELDVRPEAEKIVVLRFAGTSDGARSVELTYADVTVALIRFCKEMRIPLPRYGDKRLSPAGDGIALMVRMVIARSRG